MKVLLDQYFALTLLRLKGRICIEEWTHIEALLAERLFKILGGGIKWGQVTLGFVTSSTATRIFLYISAYCWHCLLYICLKIKLDLHFFFLIVSNVCVDFVQQSCGLFLPLPCSSPCSSLRNKSFFCYCAFKTDLYKWPQFWLKVLYWAPFKSNPAWNTPHNVSMRRWGQNIWVDMTSQKTLKVTLCGLM